MSNAFKIPSAMDISSLSDSRIKKMKDKSLWQGNSVISHDEVRKKWEPIIGDDDVYAFLRKLELAMGMRKEYIKRCCKIRHEDGPQFERDMIETLKILEEAFAKN